MVNYLGEDTIHGSYGYWGKDKTLDIQTSIEEVFDPPNISWGSAFRGSKHRSSPGMTGGFWMSRVFLWLWPVRNATTKSYNYQIIPWQNNLELNKNTGLKVQRLGFKTRCFCSLYLSCFIWLLKHAGGIRWWIFDNKTTPRFGHVSFAVNKSGELNW